ncbi:hypothetical protein P154DRAFT_530252 [Amniculicola lignicola CBS 123094]|uniref:Uncharacterized protein n=1 Tax=Amniculicola lignicola CBS 123094 TaxID=1392246 RepID=A0A6A5WXV6_9PLEO|nr:hypothetical protein P154DRAFT_530252 [Amniculicola lignicola CBS 123094]
MTHNINAITSLPPAPSARRVRISTHDDLYEYFSHSSCGRGLETNDLSRPPSGNATYNYFVNPMPCADFGGDRPETDIDLILLAGSDEVPRITLSSGACTPSIDANSFAEMGSPAPVRRPLEVIVCKGPLNRGGEGRHRKFCICEACRYSYRMNTKAMIYFGVVPPERNKREWNRTPYPYQAPLLGWDWIGEVPLKSQPEEKDTKKRRLTWGFFNSHSSAEGTSKEARRALRNSLPNQGPGLVDVGHAPKPVGRTVKEEQFPRNLGQYGVVYNDNERVSSINPRKRAQSPPAFLDSRLPVSRSTSRKRSLQHILEEEERILRETSAESLSANHKGGMKYFQKLEVAYESEERAPPRRKEGFTRKVWTMMKNWNAKTTQEERQTTRKW